MALRQLNIVLSVLMLGLVAFGTARAEEYAYSHPKVENHGRVVRLPYAAHQPREGSKVVVDLTQGGGAKEVNPGLDKVARFVNIYAGAGSQPAAAQFTVVLHGDATLIGLTDAAYSKQYDVPKNPNLALLRALQSHGVEFVVCGQSLASKGVWPDALDPTVKHAVSALTALVNLQSEGYAYVPLTSAPK